MREDCYSGVVSRSLFSFAVATALACSATAREDPIFTKIVDDSGSFGVFGNFGDGPTIDASGRVVFFAERSSGRQGYYSGNGGAVSTLIQDNTSTVLAFSPTPHLLDNGLLAFAGFPDGGGQAIYRLDTTTSILTTIADSAGPLVAFTQAHAAADGTVAFYALRDTFHDGIYKGTGGALTPIAETTGGDFDELGLTPSINNSGVVAFQGQLGSARGIYLGDGGTPSPIAHSSGEFALFAGIAPAINNLGQVAFVANLDSGPIGIFRYDDDDESITPIADDTGDFQNLTMSSASTTPARSSSGQRWTTAAEASSSDRTRSFTRSSLLAIRFSDPPCSSSSSSAGSAPRERSRSNIP